MIQAEPVHEIDIRYINNSSYIIGSSATTCDLVEIKLMQTGNYKEHTLEMPSSHWGMQWFELCRQNFHFDYWPACEKLWNPYYVRNLVAAVIMRSFDPPNHSIFLWHCSILCCRLLHEALNCSLRKSLNHSSFLTRSYRSLILCYEKLRASSSHLPKF